MKTIVSDELKMLDKMAGDFAAKELLDDREDNDKYPFGPLFEGVLAKAYDVGFFAIMLPEDAGGAVDAVNAICLVLDEVCRADASLGGIIFTNALAQEMMTQAGEVEVLKKITANATDHTGLLIAFPSFNNPGEIDNAAGAEKRKDKYVLSGDIEYVVLGGIADSALLPAKVKGEEGYSLFLVNLKGNGLDISEPILSLGLHACPAVDMSLTDVEGKLVGKEGEGGAYFEAAADRLSVAAAAMAAGVMKGSFVEAFDYTKERVQGGREIVNWSEVRMLLSGMAVKGKVADMLVDQASRSVDCGASGWQLDSRAAALHVQEMAADVTTDGIQLLGGNGYMKDYGQEKRFRDAKQIQALMGLTPMRKLKYIKRIVDGEPPW
jgi:alkylation response protein AidB-like acyl-CoA dehydrogenase